MAQWLKVCDVHQVPEPGNVMEAEASGLQICLVNLNGELSALDNLCPHQQASLGQGWIEGETVVCPWHAWTFNVKTGISEFPGDECVSVFPVKIEGSEVLVEVG